MSPPQAWLWHRNSDDDAVAEALRVFESRGYELLGDDDLSAIRDPSRLAMIVHAADSGGLGDDLARSVIELERRGALFILFSTGPGGWKSHGRDVHSLRSIALSAALAGKAETAEAIARYLCDDGDREGVVALLKELRYRCLKDDDPRVPDAERHRTVREDLDAWRRLFGARGGELETIARVNQAVALLNVLCWVRTGEGEHEFARAAEEIDAILPR